jgi:hypothetical protein
MAELTERDEVMLKYTNLQELNERAEAAVLKQMCEDAWNGPLGNALRAPRYFVRGGALCPGWGGSTGADGEDEGNDEYK